MTNTSIFKYKNYFQYLQNHFGDEKQRSGKKKEFARHINCQSSFLSQVLAKKVNLSLEQGLSANSFFHHDELESQYFMLLLQKERAGTSALRTFFEKQIEETLMKQLKVESQIKNFKVVPQKVQAEFYSNWKYQAVQSLLSIKKLQNPETLSSFLSLPTPEILRILQFLVNNQLAIRENDFFKIGPQHLHLSDDSDFLQQHHFNWRVKSMDSLGRKSNTNDLHYSAVFTLSETDVFELRKKLLEQLKANINLVKESHEEVGYAFCLDLFSLGSF